ncbi:MAG TPA: hypothetical protein VFV99_01165 [Kofleriaceae bacterium]|nr:hypothetical protein [Kofleriaceae bacterium]
MTQTATHRPLAEPFSTGASWLMRALAVSFVFHAVVAVAWWLMAKPHDDSEVQLVDIEVAPPPPKAEALPAEVAKQAEQVAAAQGAQEPETPSEDFAVIDAGIDAPVDAPGKRKKRSDAAADEMMAETADGGVGDGGEGDGGGTQVALGEFNGAGSGSQDVQGVPGATDTAQGSGAPGMDNQPAVEGAPTSAGTAANLLAYFPPGHQITVLIRFDRLRKTEWAQPAAKLFTPMPDYRGLFGDRDVAIVDQLDTLVISSPRPRDATATTLVGHTQMTRAQMRDFLANPDTPIAWSTTKGGMLGKRSGKLFPNDKRVLLSPWRGWFVLAQPTDVTGLTAASGGNLDAIEAKATLPPWLAAIRTIEDETNEVAKPAKPGEPAAKPDPKRGPALVLTLKGPSKRYNLPDVGLGVTSAPSPGRVSLAMELVKQGWLVRGNIVFATEADAIEFVATAQKAQTTVTDSRILSGLLKKQHALNAITGLSLARAGARVSYATSVSIADARALLAVAAQTLDAYFANPP